MRPKLLPERSLDEVLEAYPWHRQSVLADADTCALATKWRLEGLEASARLRSEPMTSPWNTVEQARGILAHRYAAEVLATMWETGATETPIAEALEILYEVCAQRTMRQADGSRVPIPDADVVYLPMRERRLLRLFAICLVYNPQTKRLRQWNSIHNLWSIEDRLWARISYTAPDGRTVERLITGQPDAVIRDGDDGRVVLDWKSTPKAPAKAPDRKRNDAGDLYGEDVTGNVSYEGFFQQRVYGLLVLANEAEISRVTLREVYPLDPDGMQVRTATVYREDLERITRELGIVIELLDRAIGGGSGSELWKPTPGRHCLAECPRPGKCPIPKEERREGAITGPQMAEEWAAQMVTAQGVYQHRRGALKAYHEQTGHEIPVKDAKRRLVLRHETGTRSFGLHVPADSDRGPEDRNLAATFKAAAERRKAAAG